MYKCQLPHPKDDKPVQAKGQQLTARRAPVQDVGMTKTTTMEMMMTSMIQRMTKTSWRVPNLLMLLRVHKLRCVFHYQVVHEVVFDMNGQHHWYFVNMTATLLFPHVTSLTLYMFCVEFIPMPTMRWRKKRATTCHDRSDIGSPNLLATNPCCWRHPRQPFTPNP